jgi:hypothetical protein
MQQMKIARIIFVVGTLLIFHSALNAQTGTQAGSSVSGRTSIETDKSGAQASTSATTSTSAAAGQNSASLASGTTLNASLSQSVDAKKNKPGDPITAKTSEAVKSEGQVIIPKGSKLVGHITQSKQRSKEDKESAVGVVFDRAILKSGQELPLNVTIRALAASQSAASSSFGGDDLSAGSGVMGSGRASGGGALGGVRSTAGAAAGTVSNTAANAGRAASGTVDSTVNAAGVVNGSVGGLNATGQLATNSQGVFGLEGLRLASAASAGAQGSLITSPTRNVHLDSGTQLLLVAQSSGSGASSKQEPANNDAASKRKQPN